MQESPSPRVCSVASWTLSRQRLDPPTRALRTASTGRLRHATNTSLYRVIQLPHTSGPPPRPDPTQLPRASVSPIRNNPTPRFLTGKLPPSFFRLVLVRCATRCARGGSPLFSQHLLPADALPHMLPSAALSVLFSPPPLFPILCSPPPFFSQHLLPADARTTTSSYAP